MKGAVLFFATTILGLSAGPKEAVMQILEKAREGEIVSGKLDALGMSPHVGTRKKSVITQQWKDLRDWLESEKAEIEFADLKEDGDLAAVIVNARSRKNGPDAARAYSFGLKKEGEDWKVTPVAGSFMNAGLGFDQVVADRARKLEQWMSARQARVLMEFRRAELARYQRELANKVEGKVLEEATATEAFDHFRKAIADGDADRVLIWMGLLERMVEDGRDWTRLSAAVRKGLEGEDQLKVWRLMLDEEVIRLKVSENLAEDDASFLMGYMAPYTTGASREQNRVIRFHLENTPVGWRVILPAFFEYANADSSQHYNAHNQSSDWEDRQQARALGEIFEKQNKARFAKSPGELLKMITVDLNKGDYPNFIRFFLRPESDPENEGGDNRGRAASSRYAAIGRLWKDLRGKRRDDVKVTVARKIQQKEVAAGILLFEQAGSFKPSFKAIWMVKQIEGWSMVSSQTSLTDAPFVKKYGRDARELEKKVEQAEKSLEENYLKDLLAKVPTPLDTEGAPDEAASQKVVLAWRKELGEGSITSLLDQAAMVQVPDKPNLLMRNLLGAMKGVRVAKVEERILGAKSAGQFHGVSMFVDAGRGLEMHCPLVLVATTAKGPRVLADVELWYSSNQGKRIRNGAALIRLKKILSEKNFAAVKELFDWHEKLAGPVWEKWADNLARPDRRDEDE